MPLGLDLPRLAGAAVVVAESLEAAAAVARAGAPRRSLWVLALPMERLHTGEQTGYAAELVRAADLIGGFLTDTEAARDSLERAMGQRRPRVEIFPPLAVDRPCPEHRNGAAHPDAPILVPSQPVPGAARGLHPAASQLVAWRAVLDRLAAGEPAEPPDSFATARLLDAAGLAGTAEAGDQTADPVPRSAWWSAEAQVRAARRVWDDAVPRAPSQPRRPRAALVAGFDLKFARDLADRLGNRRDLTVTIDEWQNLSRGTKHTEHHLRRAESIFAEWARTSAVWYSRRKRPDQFLAVRLHRFELDATYPREIAIDKVDAVVYIAPLFGRRIRDELGWPIEKLVYIPNFLDLGWLDRPKLPEARFAIGLVGIEWRRKRFDIALDLLAALRREDRRFTLVVRSVMPWQNGYAWQDPAERAYTGRCFERIEHDPWLRNAVIFDEPGRDMGRWFRQVGHVLSTSDEEGCHTAVAEGMASAAVPVVRPWPGASEVYHQEWVYSGLEDAVSSVLASVDEKVWAERGARARAEIRRTHDPLAVVDAWTDLLHGDLPGARAYFSAYANLTDPSSAAAPAPGPRPPAGSVASR